MKKLFLPALCAVAALSLFSCTNNLVESEVEQYERSAKTVEMTFTGSLDPDTKTAYNPANGKTQWLTNDVIRILGAHTNTTATASNFSADRTHATFTATVTEGDQLYAIYPSGIDGVSLSGDVVRFSVPNTQNGVFALANIAVSKASKGSSFYFRNATTLFQFTIDRKKYPTAAKVRIESLSSTKLTGTLEADFSDDSFNVTRASSSSSSISVDLSSIPGNDAKTAYVSVAPGIYASGVVFKIQTASGQTIRTVTCGNRLECLPGEMYTFGDLSYHLDEYIFFDTETFSKANGTGGNSGGYARPNNPVSDPDDVSDYSGWQFANCQEANACICIGDGSHDAYAITPALGISTGAATLTFKAAPASGSSLRLELYVEGNGRIDHQVLQMTSGAWKTFTIAINGADANTKIRFNTTSSFGSTSVSYPHAFFLDDVKVIDGAAPFSYVNIAASHVFIEAEQTEVLIPGSANVSVTTAQEYGNTYFESTTGFRYISIPENETRNTRRFLFTLYANSLTGLDAQRTGYVYQRGKTKVIASPETLEFPYGGATKTAELTLWNFASDRVIDVRTSNSQFAPSVEGTTVSIAAAANEGEDPVSGEITVTVSDGERERSCVISVSQAAAPIVNVEPETLAFPAAGGSDDINVTTKNFGENTTVSAESNNTAVTVSVDGEVVTVTAAANESAEAVSATVSVTVTDGTETETVEVPVTVAGVPAVSAADRSGKNITVIEFDTPTAKQECTVYIIISNFASNRTVSADIDNDEFYLRLTDDDEGTELTVLHDAEAVSYTSTATVTVTVTDEDNEVSCTLFVTMGSYGPQEQTLAFSPSAVNGYYGTDFTEPTLSGAHTTVTYSISSTNGAADIDPTSGEVTLAPVNGTATVTATAAATDAWNSATATYTITVHRLPAAYTEQEYIEGDGYKYIETGVTFNQSSRIVTDFAFSTGSNDGYLYGAMTTNASSGNNNVGADQFVLNLANGGAYYKYGTTRFQTNALDNTNRHVVDHNGNAVTLDGQPAHTFTAETFTCPGQMYLFWANYPGGSANVAKAKIYSCKMYANGTTLSRDFVPCKRNSNNVEGMYDMVSNAFFPFLDAE